MLPWIHITFKVFPFVNRSFHWLMLHSALYLLRGHSYMCFSLKKIYSRSGATVVPRALIWKLQQIHKVFKNTNSKVLDYLPTSVYRVSKWCRYKQFLEPFLFSQFLGSFFILVFLCLDCYDVSSFPCSSSWLPLDHWSCNWASQRSVNFLVQYVLLLAYCNNNNLRSWKNWILVLLQYIYIFIYYIKAKN